MRSPRRGWITPSTSWSARAELRSSTRPTPVSSLTSARRAPCSPWAMVCGSGTAPYPQRGPTPTRNAATATVPSTTMAR